MNISLVVPVFSEAETIQSFCENLLNMREDFSEVVFVDGGSRDGTLETLHQYKENLNAKIIELEFSLPGKGRNIGVQNASYDYIAFIDVGVEPDKGWLKNLKTYMVEHSTDFAWGICHYEGTNFWSKMLTSYTSGTGGSLDFVIPASIFKKEVLEKVGLFPDDMRAGEDVLFRRAVFSNYGKVNLCKEAMVYYRTYPRSSFAIFRKWFIYAANCSRENVSNKQEAAYYIFFGGIILSFFFEPGLILFLMAFYLIIRGFIDPSRRAKSLLWWSENPFSLLVGPFFVFVLDAMKCLGFLWGRLSLLSKRGC